MGKCKYVPDGAPQIASITPCNPSRMVPGSRTTSIDFFVPTKIVDAEMLGMDDNAKVAAKVRVD